MHETCETIEIDRDEVVWVYGMTDEYRSIDYDYIDFKDIVGYMGLESEYQRVLIEQRMELE